MNGLPNRLRRVFAATALAAAALPAALTLGLTLPATAQAQEKEVTIAYQQIVDPWLTAIASGEFEKATGYKIHWRQFESGAKVATALASVPNPIGITGHTDALGYAPDAKYGNWELSSDRANAARRELIACGRCPIRRKSHDYSKTLTARRDLTIAPFAFSRKISHDARIDVYANVNI